jgi:GR25 family glycosyltransferase involved in LPS biosynthesis
MLNIDKIYICHYSKLKERKQKLINHLLDNKISEYEWVESFDIDNWDIEEIKIKYPSLFNLNPKGLFLKKTEISLLLKHIWIIEQVYKNKYSNCLILEDDVVLENDFIEKFNLYTSQLPKDWDLCWVGSCCGLHANIIKDLYVYRSDSSRCTHAYMISYNFVLKIKDELKNANDAIDWFYNFLIKSKNLNNYWIEPSLAYQNGEFKTSLII